MLRFCLPVLGTAMLAARVAAASHSEQFGAGQAAHTESCAACHGETGRGGPGYANPIWGPGAQLAKYRSAAGLFEYGQLMMRFDDPTRVSDEVKLAITLYLLANHGVLPQDARLDPGSAGGVALR
jgi:mono/diheme cytochrome c family protein